MDERFSSLRFKEFLKRTAVLALSGVTAARPEMASAATGSVQVSQGQGKWFINTNITFSSTSSNWGFSEASLHTASGTRHDAFDGVLSWHVSPTPFAGNLSANGYRSPGGIVSNTTDSSGTTVTGTTQSLAGLNVSGQIFLLSSKAVARSILFLQNPTASPITVYVLSASNLGSDANTVVQTTSSGDNVFDASDNWFVSSETATPTTSNDPVLTFAFSQSGVRGTNLQAPGGAIRKDLFYESYQLTIPAGQTRSLMMFVQMSDTVANAISGAPTFSSPATLQAAGYLTGLTPAQLGQIANWDDLDLTGSSEAVPALSPSGTVMLASLAAMVGIADLQRRRKKRIQRMRRWVRNQSKD